MEIVWKTIHKPYDKYAISNTGSCKNIMTNVILSEKNIKTGYVKYSLYDNQMKRKALLAHRLVYFSFNPETDCNFFIDHINRDRLNNSLNNLQALNAKDHGIKTGKSRIGLKRKKFLSPVVEEGEIWRPVPFDPYVYVSNNGKVKHRKGHITYGSLDLLGYLNVNLKGKLIRVHRLVALTFLPKIDGCNIVNHIDENKTNNNILNLEWTTHAKNAKHSSTTGKKITIRNKHTGEEKCFESIVDAAREVKGHCANITACLHNRQKSAYGYTYRWQEN